MKRLLLLVCLLLLSFTSLTARAEAVTCPTIVQQALDAAARSCSAIGRNQACYGNVRLTAQAQPAAPPITFTHPGDLASVADLQTLTLSPLDEQQDSWGIALMKLQANLPDVLPGQNVVFVLFGDVQMQNAVPTRITLAATANNGVNLRGSPGGKIVGALTRGQSVQADGRNQAGDWLHVRLNDGTVGWASVPLLSVSGDPSALAVLDAAAPPIQPMQAFYVQTGIRDTACAQAPDSGILIQSPNSQVKVNLLINGVNITLGSTVYVQAQPGGLMTLDVLEGGIEATLGTTAYIPAGMRAQFQLDHDLHALAWAGDPQPYDPTSLVALPLRLLPAPPTVAPPLPAAQVADAQAALAQALPPPILLGGSTGGRCSVKGDTPTNATFSNQSSHTVGVYWINYDCHEELYQTLAPGASYVQATFATHPWVMRDSQTGLLLAGPVVSANGEAISLSVGG